jgi:hypothetical protein
VCKINLEPQENYPEVLFRLKKTIREWMRSKMSSEKYVEIKAEIKDLKGRIDGEKKSFFSIRQE